MIPRSLFEMYNYDVSILLWLFKDRPKKCTVECLVFVGSSTDIMSWKSVMMDECFLIFQKKRTERIIM